MFRNYKLLSFGEEAEEDEEETIEVSKKFSGKSKSTHDLLTDPKLSSMPAVLKDDVDDTKDDSSDEDHEARCVTCIIMTKANKLNNTSIQIIEQMEDNQVHCKKLLKTNLVSHSNSA